MRKNLLRMSLLTLVAIVSCGLFSGCDDYYGPDYGYGPEFYDSDLIGTWELISINGGGVSPGERNYLQFIGRGRGNYYYYSGGVPYRESMSYWCEDAYSSTYLYLSYSGSRPEAMRYWFSGNLTLWLEWHTVQGRVTYGYQYIDRSPWYAPALESADSDLITTGPVVSDLLPKESADYNSAVRPGSAD